MSETKPNPDRTDFAALATAFSELSLTLEPLLRQANHRQWFVRVPADRLLEVARFLRGDTACDYAQLCDLTGVDYLNFPDADDRFAVIYSLLSLAHNRRLWLKVFVNDPDPTVPTVTGVWPGAEWLEREVYDMFGITFSDHPDLRRILTWEGFAANPLRKDYPLRGRGEREAYERLTRESA